MYLVMFPSRLFRRIVILDKEVLKLNTPVVFVSNHRSISDPWIIASSLPFLFFIKHLPVKTLVSLNRFNKKNSVLMLAYNIGLIHLIHFLYQSIPVPEVGTSEEKLTDLQKEIDKGYSILFFPEGGINRNGLGEIKQGISILRKNNPNIPFVFVSVNYKKTSIPFFRKTTFVMSDKSFDLVDNYQGFVGDKLKKMEINLKIL